MTYAFLFCTSFCYVALKAAQQRNVAGMHYALVGPLSIGMALCEVYAISEYVTMPEKIPAALAIGTGAWLGCVVAMWAHHRYVTHGRK